MKKFNAILICLIFILSTFTYAYSINISDANDLIVKLEPIVSEIMKQNDEKIFNVFIQFTTVTGMMPTNVQTPHEYYEQLKSAHENIVKKGESVTFATKFFLLLDEIADLTPEQNAFLNANLKKFYEIYESKIPDYKYLKNAGIEFLKIMATYRINTKDKLNAINLFLNGFYETNLVKKDLKNTRLDIENYCYVYNSVVEICTMKIYYESVIQNKRTPDFIEKKVRDIKLVKKIDESAKKKYLKTEGNSQKMCVEINQIMLDNTVQYYNAIEKDKISVIDENALDILIKKSYLKAKDKKIMLDSISSDKNL